MTTPTDPDETPRAGTAGAGAVAGARTPPSSGPRAIRHRSARATVERAAAGGEAPLRRLVGSGRANPLPHAGTISVFLLGVVIVTGVYVTLFYEYGFDASHAAVTRMQHHPIQHTMRSVHRYSSAALVLTTVVHAWRIFVAGRFTRSRRTRWLTGLSALVLVWLAGVTGYWLVWDQRAGALAEATNQVIGGSGWGAAWVVDHLIGTGAGSGSSLMVVVWFVHIVLTAVIGFFMWRHLRRSRLAWLPPKPWMAAMAAALVLVALVFPADLLAPVDGSALVPDMPLDPFVLFLLPPLLHGDVAWVAIVGLGALAAVVAVPWILRDGDETVVSIDADRCTGCELCVIDCPYVALTMTSSSEDGRDRGLAVVDPARCVGCGICVGSCSFGAIALPGHGGVAAFDPAGRDVVVACRRQVRTGSPVPADHAVLEVQCTGMFHAQAVGDLSRRGARRVQIVGCAPGDCAYGTGNILTHERLTGSRAPHVARALAGAAHEDYVGLGGLPAAVRDGGHHPEADPAAFPESRRARIAGAAVVVTSLVGVALATLVPFGGESADAAVRVIVDHRPGAILEGQTEVSGGVGDDTSVVVRVDGDERTSTTMPVHDGTAVGVVDVAVEPGERLLDVLLVVGDTQTVLFRGDATIDEGRRFVIEARDIPPPPGAAEGRRVFDEPRLGGCGVCHSTSPGDDGVGPSLAGVGTTAALRVEGLSASEYLRQSIIDPDAYIVEGYRAGQMLPVYGERLSVSQREALVDYLLTLEDAS